jgi:hypothetical protein
MVKPIAAEAAPVKAITVKGATKATPTEGAATKPPTMERAGSAMETAAAAAAPTTKSSTTVATTTTTTTTAATAMSKCHGT